MILAALCATVLIIDVLAHRVPVIENHVAAELEKQRTQNGRLMYDAGYQDDGDYVLIDQIPNDDFSRGGVYFIGASEMKITLMPWLMSADEKRLIHNYSLGDLRHGEVRNYLKMLIDEDGLLKAGGGKTTIFLGASYQMTRHKDLKARPMDRYIENLFERHGFYEFDAQGGMHRAKMWPIDRYVRLERDRISRFLSTAFFPESKVEVNPLKDQWKREHILRVMVDDWQASMATEVDELGKTIDYLQAQGVNVCVIYPPSGSWQKTLPYEAYYRDLMTKVLSTRHVTVIDQHDLLRDDDFIDFGHARYQGQVKLHHAYMALAYNALQKMGTPLRTEASKDAARATD